MRGRLALLGSSESLLVLGAVQGATEFLPISSDGHLVLMQAWLGMETDGGLSREIALHLGTLVAVIVFCGADLRAMLGRGSAGLWRLVLGSTLVTGIVGLLVRDVVETRLNHVLGAGCGLLITSLMLLVVAPRDDRRLHRTLDQGTLLDAVLLGLFQSVALAPGISRSGLTIVCGLLLGFQRPHAVRIAFLMSIPAVGGAVLLDSLLTEEPLAVTEPGMLPAMGVACIVGFLCLRFMAVRVDPRSLRLFGLYTLVLGLAAITSTWIR